MAAECGLDLRGRLLLIDAEVSWRRRVLGQQLAQQRCLLLAGLHGERVHDLHHRLADDLVHHRILHLQHARQWQRPRRRVGTANSDRCCTSSLQQLRLALLRSSGHTCVRLPCLHLSILQ